MRFIGLLSYGLYLTHRTALMLAARWIPSSHVLQVVLGFMLSMAFCYALHVLVEAPAAQLRKRLSSQRMALPKEPKERAARMPTPVHPSVAAG
jgi:peptidoglycan/LPS O-acetylase OafA/YrhL